MAAGIVPDNFEVVGVGQIIKGVDVAIPVTFNETDGGRGRSPVSAVRRKVEREM